MATLVKASSYPELTDTRSAKILSLLVLLIVPSVITGLQISQSNVNTVVRSYPASLITLSVFYYIFIGLIPAWSMIVNPNSGLKYEWFIMMIFLYLLWSSLLFTFGQVLWSYVVLVILLIISIFPLRPVFQKAHPAFALLYLISFLWLVYLLVIQTVALFKGQY